MMRRAAGLSLLLPLLLGAVVPWPWTGASGEAGQCLVSQGDAGPPAWGDCGAPAEGSFSGVGACGSNTWASTLNEGEAPTCTQPGFANLSGAASDSQVPNNITVDLATAATALAGNGANCSGNNFALGVNAAGAAECAQPAFSNLSGTATDGQLASNYSGVGACSPGQFVTAVNDNAAPTCAAPAAGAGPTVVRVINDVSNTSNVNWADVTGLTKAVTSGVSYTFSCEITYTTAATTTAVHLATGGPTVTALDYGVEIDTSATAVHKSTQTAHDTVTNPATGGGTTRLTATLNGSIVPSANGTLAIRLKSEINTSAVTVKRGSWCEFHTLP